MERNTKEQKELVRVDLNIEKWELFTTRRYKGKSREIVRVVKDEFTGEIKENRVIIGRTSEGIEVGILTAIDSKVLYSIISLWEQKNKPYKLNFKISEIVGKLGLPDTSEVYEQIRRSILRLAEIPITFIQNYYTKKGTERITVVMKILDTVVLFERKRDDPNKPYLGLSTLTFNQYFLENLLNGYVKPLRLDVIKELNSDIAVILYRHLDIVMFDRTDYEIKAERLVELCGLSKNYPLRRVKSLVKKSLAELVGKELTSGVIIKAEIEECVSGGWKCVFEKASKKVCILQQAEKPTEQHQQLQQETKDDKKLVWFRYESVTAKDVKLAGSFNNWRPESMGQVGSKWSLPVELTPGRYEYKFVVDGEWILDPQNPYAVTKENGIVNSVLVVE